MDHFERRLKTTQGTFSFYFNRIYTAGGMRYHVSLVDEYRQLQVINLFLAYPGQWQMEQKELLPFWLQDLESALNDILKAHVETEP